MSSISEAKPGATMLENHQPDGNTSSDQVSAIGTHSPKHGLAGHDEKFADVTVESAGWDAAQTKRLLRRIDLHLLPFLSCLYLLSFLDRTNIGNARLANLEADLGMNPLSLQFNTAVAVFFPFYVLAEIPSNLAMKRFRPSIWIPSIMIAWGVVCTLMGLVQNYGGLLGARMALGFAEGGLFPGITYYITLWYKRNECGLRMAIFFSAATAAGAFGGLLARGIIELDGVANLSGWSWIFIIEGILTVLVALFAFWAMYDYPDTAKFLAPAERQEVLRRLEEDRSVLADEFDLKYLKHALRDWKIWVHMFITIGIYTPLYSIATFMPSIVRDLGYTNERAQLMTVPPYFAACFCCVIGGWGADRHGQRGVWMIGYCLIAMTGFAILVATENNQARYAACFLATCGIYPNVPQGVAWNGNNIGGSTKRGVGIAMHVGFGNLGGFIAGYVYRVGLYRQGHIVLLSTTTMSCLLSVFMTMYLRRENARRNAVDKAPADYTYEEKKLQREAGDNATFFRYVV